MNKRELDTPALLLDADLFERNLLLMGDFVSSYGKKLRPHAKTHKCPQIAKKQLEKGNCAGICAAKLSEAEALAASGINDILITSPVTAPMKIARLGKLNKSISSLKVVADSPEQIRLLARQGTAENPLHVLVDVDPEMGRTGVPFGEAFSLGRFIASFPSLILDGVQCYAGHLQHIVSFAQRAGECTRLMKKGAEVFHELKKEFPSCRIYTGGGTGTSPADVLIEELTDIQAGSYCLMDSEYLAVEHGGPAFFPALTLLSGVISRHRKGEATIDAGTKEIYVTPGAPPKVIRRGKICEEYRYSWDFGDEHGHLFFPENVVLRSGDTLEMIVSHCDPTVNLFDRLYVVKGEEVLDCWEITLRGCCR
ncbi:MAG: DSD1 family PLP-dependent enzyme [Lentisphaeria bacterium]|nr:DSD1 family PLP-dependent enzyme [Lentisphaeria bacterium]